MTAVSDNMPGWFKRRRAAAEADNASGNSEGGTVSDVQTNGATASMATSVTTGGGSSNEPVVVWEAANLMEAQVVKGRLESEGIPAFIRSEAAGVIYGLTAGSLARADVLVPGPLADKAVEILFGDEPSEESGDEPGDVPSDDSDDLHGDQSRSQAER